jgi:outer membrane protein TolC
MKKKFYLSALLASAALVITLLHPARAQEDAAREAEYQQASLSLVAEVARTYIEARTAEKQAAIAQKNLEAQQKTLDLINHQKTQGEAPQLDVERAQGLVNTTKAEIPEYQRIADNARLRLTVLTGALPDQIKPLMEARPAVTPATIRPVMTSPAQVLALRPDVAAASSLLAAQTDLTQSAIAEIFPRITLGAFFGLQDTQLIDPTRIWSGTINAVVSLLDFGRIQGNVDAAKAREEQAYETWRKTVLQAVTDVETSLTDYAKSQERTVLLRQAAANAGKSLDLSDQLYKEGEISFLDVLDAQRTRNNAEAAVVASEAAQSQALIALYKSLGVY